MNYSIRNLVIAGGLAILAIVAVLIYTSNVKQSAKEGQARVTVFIVVYFVRLRIAPSAPALKPISPDVTSYREEGNTALPSLSTRPQHYQRDVRAHLVCCGKPMIRLHSFWTARLALSKSVSPEMSAVCA